MCTAHDSIIPFHENEACTQYNERVAREIAQAEEEEARIRREHEAASAAEVAKSSVECPGCGVQIQKIMGCNHMTCKYIANPSLFDNC
jgi:E3 ubiquitin-protein ligase RNF14